MPNCSRSKEKGLHECPDTGALLHNRRGRRRRRRSRRSRSRREE